MCKLERHIFKFDFRNGMSSNAESCNGINLINLKIKAICITLIQGLPHFEKNLYYTSVPFDLFAKTAYIIKIVYRINPDVWLWGAPLPHRSVVYICLEMDRENSDISVHVFHLIYE
jgi:hypothetical protein